MLLVSSFLIAFVGMALVSAEQVTEIDVQTGNCGDCDMDGNFGKLSVMVCGRSDPKCCVAHNLDNSNNNFETGALDVFSGSDLRECNQFELGEISSSSDIMIKIYHSGTDSGTFDWVQFQTSNNELYRCDFSGKKLDNLSYATPGEAGCTRLQ